MPPLDLFSTPGQVAASAILSAPDLLNCAEAARVLDVSVHTVARYWRVGALDPTGVRRFLPGVKLNGRLRFSRADVLAYADCLAGTTPDRARHRQLRPSERRVLEGARAR